MRSVFLACCGLIAGAAAWSADEAPALRTVVTPSGLMLELPSAASAPPAPKPPATGVETTDRGPMRVLIEPASSAATLRSALAKSAAPATPPVEAHPAANGAQVLVLSQSVPPEPAAPRPNLPVVDIDTKQVGTRPSDPVQPDVLYRAKPVAAAASAAR